MFSCTTRFNCDICGTGYISTCERMSDCISKDRFRYMHRSKGWKTVYGKYDICPTFATVHISKPIFTDTIRHSFAS